MLTSAQTADRGRLDALWNWCLSSAGREAAANRAAQRPHREMLSLLIANLRAADAGAAS